MGDTKHMIQGSTELGNYANTYASFNLQKYWQYSNRCF